MSKQFLDLNLPADAQAYILTWVEAGDDFTLNDSEPESWLLLARQLFLHHDPRPAANEALH